MVVYNPYQLDEDLARQRAPNPQRDLRALEWALTQYEWLRLRAIVWRVWARLRGRPDALLDLRIVEATSAIRSRHYAGTQTVSIAQIRGTEGRHTDFDVAFHPLRPYGKSRWVSVAMARHLGVVLPPVELIRLGDLYFVRDGHHRISVAHALGQRYIDAVVIVWQVCGPLPWEEVAGSRSLRPVQT